MNVNWTSPVAFILIIAVTGVAAVFWLFALVAIWLLLRGVGTTTDFWTMAEALSTAVTAAAVLGAGLVAYRELNEVASSRHVEVADRLFEELNSDKNIEARRWVFQNLTGDPEADTSSLEAEGRTKIKQVLNSLDRVAFLTQENWIPDEMIMPWMNPMVVKAWIKLKPYVEYERKRRGEPDYYLHASELAERCMAWRERNMSNPDITWIEDAL